MRLIDADALMEKEYSRLREGEVLYRIPPSHIDTVPIIDPVHAAGAVYCKECKYHDDEVYPGREWELNEHQECWCNWWDSVMPLNGFCSEGRKDEMKDE